MKPVAINDPLVGVVREGILTIGKNEKYYVPCANGIFCVYPLGPGTLLLLHNTSERDLMRLLAYGDTPIFSGRVHIQGCILRCVRIRTRNHTSNKGIEQSMHHPAGEQICTGYRQRRRMDTDCSFHSGENRTVESNDPVCTLCHSSNRRNHFHQYSYCNNNPTGRRSK